MPMIKYDDTTFVVVKDKDGEGFLCPINSGRSASPKPLNLNEDCIEEDVVGRYAGNINKEST